MKSIFLGGILFIALVFQTTVLPHITLFGVWPDLLLLLTIVFALLRGSDEGKWFGLAAGLLADLFLGRWFGIQTLLKMLVGYSAGWFSGKYFVDHLGVPALLTVAFVSIQELVLYIMSRSSGELSWQLGWFFRSVWPWVLLYSLVLMPWIYQAMLRINPRVRRNEFTSNRAKRPGR